MCNPKTGCLLVDVESKDKIKSKIGRRKDLFPAASKENTGDLSQIAKLRKF